MSDNKRTSTVQLGLLLLSILLAMMLMMSITTLVIVNKLTERIITLETVPEKTLEIVVERAWDRKNARYIYKLDNVKETIHARKD